ncbi:MAG: hypothetical protein MR648_06695 [Clostridiales bacterium]|nr:hypothetical protein [Clostridiales bacterium]MDY4182543.1 hypothetical protein [Pseudoflavonifractor sp.]
MNKSDQKLVISLVLSCLLGLSGTILLASTLIAGAISPVPASGILFPLSGVLLAAGLLWPAVLLVRRGDWT